MTGEWSQKMGNQRLAAGRTGRLQIRSSCVGQVGSRWGAKLLFVILWTAMPAAGQLWAQELPKIEGSYQIERGTHKGWLIVRVDIPEGCHIYSLTQEGTPPPTRLTLAETKSVELLEKFRSDKKPHVVEHDPIFEQRVESHGAGKVSFLAPMRVAEGENLENLTLDLRFHGQVCSDAGCKPLFDHPVKVNFGGYYDPPKPRDQEEIRRPKR
jgi:hypothetical protein